MSLARFLLDMATDADRRREYVDAHGRGAEGVRVFLERHRYELKEDDREAVETGAVLSLERVRLAGLSASGEEIVDEVPIIWGKPR